MRTLLIILVGLVGLVAPAGCKREAKPAQPLADIAHACSRGGDLACPRAILYVTDLAASQRYYRDKLGFAIDWTYDDDFGSVSRGDTQLFMCQRCQGHPGSWLWVFTPDVDRLHDELVGRGAIIKQAPTDQPWGVREMQVADLDGNVLRLASPGDH